MKLDHLLSSAFAVGAMALACGCSGSSTAVAPRAPQLTASAPAAPSAPLSAPGAVGTTSLMSAELPGPAPKVGKAHLALEAFGAFERSSPGGDERDERDPRDPRDGAPKEARRSDGSRRGGGFGSSK